MKYRNPDIPEGINTSESNPLKEFALLTSVVIAGAIIVTAVLAFFVESIAGYIPFEFEQAISRQVEEKINNDSNEVDVYLQDLADQVVPYMNLPEGMDVKLHYVNEEVVNAMATVGGHVMIYRGLLEKLPHENALVMLLGHEIGHVKMRHPVKALGKGVIISLLLSTILGESSDAVANVISESSMLTILSFSRDQEQDSDAEGVQLLNNYYGHVQGATSLFDVLQNEQRGEYFNVPQFLSSHPDTQYRIKLLHEMTEQNNWIHQGETNPIPENIRLLLENDKKEEVKS